MPRQRMRKQAKVLNLAKRYMGFGEGRIHAEHSLVLLKEGTKRAVGEWNTTVLSVP